MLVLSRKKNERFTIGDDIEIVVIEIRGDRVRLGVKAPANVPVKRDDMKKDYVETRRAAGVPLSDIEDALDLAENMERQGHQDANG